MSHPGEVTDVCAESDALTLFTPERQTTAQHHEHLQRRQLLTPPPKDNVSTQHATSSLPPAAVAALLMCVAVTLFSCLDASAKYLITVYDMPTEQVTWVRFVGQFIGLMVLVPAFKVMSLRRLFESTTTSWQLVRSVLMAATTLFNFLALNTLRLDQTVTIFFLTPLVVALAAGPLLGEWVGWRRALAILVGFVGILIAVRPGVAPLSMGMLFAFLAMSAYVLFILLTRHIAGRDPPLVTLFYSMFAGVVLGLPMGLPVWVTPPDALAVLLLLGLGVFGGIGHYLLIIAHDRAPASAIAPFLYAQLIAMVALGYLVFSDLPDRWTLIGSTVVIASGLYLFHRERVQHVEHV